MWLNNLIICILIFKSNFGADFSPSSETIFAVTAVIPSQILLPQVIRLGNTLNLIENIHWVLISPSLVRPEVREYLDRLEIKYTFLVELSEDNGSALNTGLRWIKENYSSGIVYFASTDHVLDTRLFDEIWNTKKISMFPVAYSSAYMVSSPVVKDGKFDGYCTDNPKNEKHPIDLAGVAFSLDYLKERKARFGFIPKVYSADSILNSMGEISPEDIEVKAKMATQVLVWRNPIEPAGRADKREILLPKYKDTNLVELEKLLY